MTVRDKTLQGEGLSVFFKNLGKKGLNVSKQLAENLLSNPGRALDITAKIATLAVSKKSKRAPSTFLELITFYNTRKGLYLDKFVLIMLYKGNKKHKDYTQPHDLKLKMMS